MLGRIALNNFSEIGNGIFSDRETINEMMSQISFLISWKGSADKMDNI